jgi:phosphoribosylformylglycinamidine (FGAM) synthase-like enzyme
MNETLKVIALENAEKARLLMADDAMQDALKALEAAYTHQWRDSEPEDTQKREDAFNMLRCLDHFKAELESAIKGGNVALFNSRGKITK